jgi:hypothetical protein
MYGRVVNKRARHNICFSDFDQEPDYEPIVPPFIPPVAPSTVKISSIARRLIPRPQEENSSHSISKKQPKSSEVEQFKELKLSAEMFSSELLRVSLNSHEIELDATQDWISFQNKIKELLLILERREQMFKLERLFNDSSLSARQRLEEAYRQIESWK